MVRFQEEYVIKTAWGVTIREAENLQAAYNLVDPRIVRVPRFVQFFEVPVTNSSFSPRGYLVMEYVPGAQLDLLSHQQMLALAGIVDHLLTIPGTVPGSLSGGEFTGPAFDGAQAAAIPAGDVIALEKWINDRQVNGPQIELQPLSLVLCHMDIAPRNIIWPHDGGIPYIVDWESAAFLPRSFELCSHMISGSLSADFHEDFLAILKERLRLTDHEERVMEAFLAAWSCSQTYSVTNHTKTSCSLTDRYQKPPRRRHDGGSAGAIMQASDGDA